MSLIREPNPFDIEKVSAKVNLKSKNKTIECTGSGNGPISAAVHALRTVEKVADFELEDYQEQSLGHGEDATAMAYVQITRISDKKTFFGAGEHSNIDWAAVKALISAINLASK
jgi:2-isopropylmalate synthase